MTPAPKSCIVEPNPISDPIWADHIQAWEVGKTHGKVLEQARTQVQPSIRTTRTSILNDSLSRLASHRDGNSLAAFRTRITSPELGRVEGDGPCGILVQVSTGTETDRGVVVGHSDARVAFGDHIVGCGDGEGEGGGSQCGEGDHGGGKRHHRVACRVFIVCVCRVDELNSKRAKCVQAFGIRREGRSRLWKVIRSRLG